MNRDNPAQKMAFQSETTACHDQLQCRDQLTHLYLESPLPTHDLLHNIGLYIRSSILVKFIVMNQLYERIKDIPGNIVEFGTWWGHNMVLCENLRAIHEPFNKQRRIIGFDTFAGFTDFSKHDRPNQAFDNQAYTTPQNYKEYLINLLSIHEGNNVLGHIHNCHDVIEGDVEHTAPDYFKAHPEMIIALAYFDMSLYKPTKAALSAIKNHLIPGSILLMDELTWNFAPGEAIALKEVLRDIDYSIEKVQLYPSKSIVKINKLK